MKTLATIALLLASSSAALAAQPRTVATDWIACPDKQHLEESTMMIANGNTNGGILHAALNSCVMIGAGETVLVQDQELISGLASFRRKGQYRLYWTHRKALSR